MGPNIFPEKYKNLDLEIRFEKECNLLGWLTTLKKCVGLKNNEIQNMTFVSGFPLTSFD